MGNYINGFNGINKSIVDQIKLVNRELASAAREDAKVWGRIENVSAAGVEIMIEKSWFHDNDGSTEPLTGYTWLMVTSRCSYEIRSWHTWMPGSIFYNGIMEDPAWLTELEEEVISKI